MGVIATAIATSGSAKRGAATATLDAIYAQDAIETQRDLIGMVPGSGPIRGVHVFKSEVYVFRDNASVDACLMYKATTNGFVQVDLGAQVEFNVLSADVADGETLTQGAVSATIDRVVLQSGAVGGAAGGYIILSDIVGGSFIAGVSAASGGATFVLSGAETENTMLPGGRFEFDDFNFFGSSGTFRMYGVDGVNPAFEFDGETFVPIVTGSTNDSPTHLAINEYHLMLCFEKGSLQNSGTGNPYDWGGITSGGAAEIGTGDELIALKKEVGASLIVLCRNKTYQLQGKNTNESPWDLKTIADESGAIEWSTQRIGNTRYLDDRGFTRVEAVQAYGDFKDSVYSQLIDPLVIAKTKSTEVSASIIVKDKNQMRTYYADGTGIVATFNNKKLAGFTTVRYANASGAAVPVRCTANGENSIGNEILFFGSDDGYLYQMDKGTSFDGAKVASTLLLAYYNVGSPSVNKQFKKVMIEADGVIGTPINYNVLLDYSSGNAPIGITLQGDLASGGSNWNEAAWNAFSWASEDVSLIEGNISGVGRNISLQISSVSTYVEPHTLFGVTYHYLNRKLVR